MVEIPSFFSSQLLWNIFFQANFLLFCGFEILHMLCLHQDKTLNKKEKKVTDSFSFIMKLNTYPWIEK